MRQDHPPRMIVVGARAEREMAGRPGLAAHFMARAEEYDQDAELVRRMLQGAVGHFDDAAREVQSDRG